MSGLAPFSQWGEAFGKARGVVDLFFTLIFVMSATVLTAAWRCCRASPSPAPPPGRARPAGRLRPQVLRRWLPLQLVTSVVALAGAAVLLGLARQRWRELS